MGSDHAGFSWIRLPAAMDSLHELRDFVGQQARAVPVSSRTHDRLELVLEEVVLNIINYAYPPHEPGPIAIGCRTGPDNRFWMRVQDRGRPFNPLQQDPPQLQADIDKQEIGGLGIFLTKHMADSLGYHYEDGANILDIGLNLS